MSSKGLEKSQRNGSSRVHNQNLDTFQFGRQLGLPLPPRHSTHERGKFAMFPNPSSAAWLAAAALVTTGVYFVIRITSKRRFYRDHDIVCAYLPYPPVPRSCHQRHPLSVNYC